MIFRSPWPDIEPSTLSLYKAVLGGAGRFGDKAAIIEGETGRVLTYRELIAGSERVAAGLAHAGLAPGQPVAVVLPNCIEFVLAWYGTLRAGGWIVPINPLYTPGEMEFQIRDSGARFLIGTADAAAAMASVVQRSFVVGGNWTELADCGYPAPDVHRGPDDTAAQLYSSGTTGKPKGVIQTHGNIVANIRQQISQLGGPEDVIVNILPLYHAAGLHCFLDGFLFIGATGVLMRQFDLERYLALCERYRATMIGGPPPVILALTKSPLWDKFRLDSVKYALCGAAPLGAELHEAFEKRTGVFLGQAWGMTETAALISFTPLDPARRKFGSCGYLTPSLEAQVVDVVSQRPLGTGETGEIWLRGPQIMRGYWNQPAATAETLVADGWMRTGDLGYFDADGCVYLVDRLKELIKYNALQVAPAELEDIIQSHPAVRDAAVVGAPEPSVGEIPMAFVVVREGASLDASELMAYVATRVAPYKKIRAVEFVDTIPKSPAGKILRRVLKDRVRARAADSAASA